MNNLIPPQKSSTPNYRLIIKKLDEVSVIICELDNLLPKNKIIIQIYSLVMELKEGILRKNT